MKRSTRAAYLVGYLSLALLAFFLVSCGGELAGESEDESSATTRPFIAELTITREETTSPTTSPDEEPSEVASAPIALAADCEATPPDMLGPYYVPDEPVRNSVESGYLTFGNVLSAASCEPIPGAQVEFWLADSQGNYGDAHRATVLVGEGGEYGFQSNFPGLYENRPPHIHIRVTAPGFQELVTQHYPEAGQTEAAVDLVLVPA